MRRISIISYLLILFCFFLSSCAEKERVQTCMECPVVSSLSKTTGRVNDTITITGVNFAESGNHVFFNTKEAKINFETSNKIVAYVPANCGTGPVVVQRPDQLISNNDKEFAENLQKAQAAGENLNAICRNNGETLTTISAKFPNPNSKNEPASVVTVN